MKDSCENCQHLTKDKHENDICDRNGCFLPFTNQFCNRWAKKRFPKQSTKKKPQKCNLVLEDKVIATMASRHIRKIEDFLDKQPSKSSIKAECFYCKQPLLFILSNSTFGFFEGVTFCPVCFPEEHKQQQNHFELKDGGEAKKGASPPTGETPESPTRA